MRTMSWCSVVLALALPAAACERPGGDARASDSAAAGGDAAAERELAALADSLHAAESRGDTAALARLLADDFQMIHGGGRASKAELLARISPDPPGMRTSVRDAHVRVHGPAAVSSRRVTVTGAPGAPAGQAESHAVMQVWAHRAARWQIVAMMVTPAQDDRPR